MLFKNRTKILRFFQQTKTYNYKNELAFKKEASSFF
jgi:hypothetical protein